jgi:hypothetical protein
MKLEGGSRVLGSSAIVDEVLTNVASVGAVILMLKWEASVGSSAAAAVLAACEHYVPAEWQPSPLHAAPGVSTRFHYHGIQAKYNVCFIAAKFTGSQLFEFPGPDRP